MIDNAERQLVDAILALSTVIATDMGVTGPIRIQVPDGVFAGMSKAYKDYIPNATGAEEIMICGPTGEIYISRPPRRAYLPGAITGQEPIHGETEPSSKT